MSIIALGLADLHINDWPKPEGYNGDRLLHSCRPLDVVGQRAKALGVPILFSGDLIHKPKAIDNRVLESFIDYYRTYIEDLGVDFIAISGNHDQSQKNTFQHKSPSYIKSFSKVFKTLKCVDCETWTNKNIVVCGIPYYTHNKGFNRALKRHRQTIKGDSRFKILLIHTDLPGATNTAGFEIKESRKIMPNLHEHFREFDLVLAGHIHKPQQLARTVIMMGSPGHQNSGDMGMKMGYWEIHNDGVPILVPLDLPQYKYCNPKLTPPDTYHIYIPHPKKVKEIAEGNFSNSLKKTSIAKNYLKATGVKSKRKKKALVTLLKEIG